MKHFYPVVITSILFLLTACLYEKKQEDPSLSKYRLLRKSQSSEEKIIFQGLLSKAEGRFHFLDCALGNNYYQVIDASGTLDSLYQLISATYQIATHEALYCELLGYVSPEKHLSHYHDGSLVVKQVHHLYPKNFRNTCIPYEFWAIGTEPFWSLQISKAENLIEWKNGSEGTLHQFIYVLPETIGSMIHYLTQEINSGKPLDIRIEQRPCTDGMSENEYEYELIMTYGEKSYAGCAMKWGQLPVTPK